MALPQSRQTPHGRRSGQPPVRLLDRSAPILQRRDLFPESNGELGDCHRGALGVLVLCMTVLVPMELHETGTASAATPSTSVLIPSNGSTVSGDAWVEMVWMRYIPLTKQQGLGCSLARPSFCISRLTPRPAAGRSLELSPSTCDMTLFGRSDEGGQAPPMSGPTSPTARAHPQGVPVCRESGTLSLAEPSLSGSRVRGIRSDISRKGVGGSSTTRKLSARSWCALKASAARRSA
jgi:hypothetical protein